MSRSALTHETMALIERCFPGLNQGARDDVEAAVHAAVGVLRAAVAAVEIAHGRDAREYLLLNIGEGIDGNSARIVSVMSRNSASKEGRS